jgi:hypothetical protein
MYPVREVKTSSLIFGHVDILGRRGPWSNNIIHAFLKAARSFIITLVLSVVILDSSTISEYGPS